MSNEEETVETEEADESAADAEEEGAEEAGGIQHGDFVRLSYTMRTADDDSVVDTTIEEVAEEAGFDIDDIDFGPRLIVVGEGHVFEAVDEALLGAETGDTGTVEVPAAEAFGEVDQDEIRTVSASKIDEDNRYPGAQVQIDGQQGRVETVVGGRARVNYNHPLAGQDIEYEYEIVEVVDDPAEKAKGLLGLYLQNEPEVWIQTDEVEEETQVEVESDADDDDEDAEPEYETEIQIVEKETLYIEATPQMTMNQQWLFSKQQIAQDVIERLDLDRVIVQETIEGMGGMMGGMGGMMGGMGGAGAEDIEEALEDVDVDADELVEELEGEELEDEEFDLDEE